MNDIVQLLKSFTTPVCMSGGAKGSDVIWGQFAAEAGHKVIHWGFNNLKSSASESEIIRLTNEQLLAANPALNRANQLIKRTFPTGNPYTNSLLRRSWYQVAWTDSVYSIGEIRNDEIMGGTSWAVTMYMDRFLHGKEDIAQCKLFFYDQILCEWLGWQNSWTKLEHPPEKPNGIWTGIGTRYPSKTAVNAMRDIFTGNNHHAD